MLAQAVLEVGGNDMSPAICGIESSELAVRRNADVCKRPYVKEPVFALGRIDHVDRLLDAQKDFHGPRQCVAWRDDRPGVNVAFGDRGQLLRPRLVIG